MITKKQEQIKGLLDEGKSVDEITAILSVTRSAVYGHIRRMRELGVDLPDSVGAVGTRRTSARSKSRPTTELGRRTASAPNAEKLAAEFKERIVAEREAIDRRLAEIDDERVELTEQRAKLDDIEKNLPSAPERTVKRAANSRAKNTGEAAA